MGLRVAMACPRFAPLTGGTETHVSEVSDRLSRRGVTVTVLTTEVPGTPAVERRAGVEVQRFRRLDAVGDLYVAPGIGGAIEEGPFDLVHVQGVHTAVPWFALRSARRRGLSTVVTFHTGGHSGRLRTRLRDTQWRILRPYLRQVDQLVAVCEYEIELFSTRIGIPPSRFSLIRNGAEPAPVAAGEPDISGDPLVLSVGRLERYKGHHRVIAALPELLRKAPGAHVGIVGKGPYERRLRRLAAELGVERNVSFSSFDADERGRLSALMVSADVIALVSDYEAHPVSVMEASALHVPVVVAEGSGMTELVRDGLALAVPVDASPRVLADALLDARRRRPRPAPVEQSDWDECAGQLLELYGSLAGSA
jgi:glycosyltransferase involved in cell wall biosynthesis